MIEKTVYYHDTDAVGIMYHGAYLKILEEGRDDFFLSHGIFARQLHKKGKYFVITELKVKYKKPARFGDTVVCESAVNKVTGAQIFFSQKIYNKQSNDILIEAQVAVVIINKLLQPLIIPESVRSRLP